MENNGFLTEDADGLSVNDLKSLFQEKAIGIEDCAHLCIDVQKIYANFVVADHIANGITPAFRSAAIPNYWVHYAETVDENKMPTGPQAFQSVVPIAGEDIIRKNHASAFQGSYIDTLLQNDKKRLVAITGFAFGCCVRATAEDAIARGYETIILTDGTDTSARDQEHYVRLILEQEGAKFTSSENFFKALKAT